MEMSCLIPPACVFCTHYHAARNEHSDALPSCNAFAAIPDEIFMGRFDHSAAFPGDRGLRFSLIESDRLAFQDLNAVRRELGLLAYPEPPVGQAGAGAMQVAGIGIPVQRHCRGDRA
jgi:hypothetical protein